MTTACRAVVALLAICAAGCCCSPCCNYPCACYPPVYCGCCSPCCGSTYSMGCVLPCGCGSTCQQFGNSGYFGYGCCRPTPFGMPYQQFGAAQQGGIAMATATGSVAASGVQLAAYQPGGASGSSTAQPAQNVSDLQMLQRQVNDLDQFKASKTDICILDKRLKRAGL